MYQRFILFLLLAFVAPTVAQGDEKGVKLQTQLVWGTNQDKPAGKNLKDVGSVLSEKLRKIFKWKNYFEVSRQMVDLPKQAAQRIKMSSKCELEFCQCGSDSLEVKLFGEGKLVIKKRQPLVLGEPIVLAGDDKNDTAWFVVIQAVKE
jgi:hypothetical protein